MTKTLIILRHAKTEAGTPSQGDEARRLVQRGIDATRIMGAHMVSSGIKPDKVLCSTAIRTTETLLGIEREYRVPLPVTYVEKLYLASAGEMLNIIGAVEDSVKELLVIAHNPGIHELCMKLARAGDEKLVDKMALKFPTCALAKFTCHAPDWGTISLSRSELVEFVSPKMLGQVIDS